LSDCISISYGTRTSKRFVDYDVLNGRPWLCLFLNFGHLTFDLECPNEAQLNAWLFGLQSLTHVNTPVARGRVLWERAKLKVEQRAARAKMTPMDMRLKIIAVAQASGPFVARDTDANPMSPLAYLLAAWCALID
jgi:hypothetical protein